MLQKMKEFDFIDETLSVRTIVMDYDFESNDIEEFEIDLEDKDHSSAIELLSEYFDGSFFA